MDFRAFQFCRFYNKLDDLIRDQQIVDMAHSRKTHFCHEQFRMALAKGQFFYNAAETRGIFTQTTPHLPCNYEG